MAARTSYTLQIQLLAGCTFREAELIEHIMRTHLRYSTLDWLPPEQFVAVIRQAAGILREFYDAGDLPNHGDNSYRARIALCSAILRREQSGCYERSIAPWLAAALATAAAQNVNLENGAVGIRDIEGKVARVAMSDCGQGTNFKSDKILLISVVMS